MLQLPNISCLRAHMSFMSVSHDQTPYWPLTSKLTWQVVEIPVETP